MSRSLSLILYTLGCLLWGISASRTPCGHQQECVPNALCGKGASRQSSSCQRAETCCHISQMISVGAPLHCGQSYPDGLYGEVEVTASQAKPHQFPWIVALLESRHFLGGGSLVTENCVLTAAHLLLNKSEENILVRAGAWDLTVNEWPIAESRSVARIILHSEFSRYTGANNVALIVLKSSFQAKPHIGFICQPRPGMIFDHHRCVVSGWGKVTNRDTGFSPRLKRISLPIVDRATCQARLRRTRLGKDYQLHTSLICAGGETNMDACEGNGGSPLMCPIAGQPTQYELAGIVNGGVGCGDRDVPGLYTSVPEMKPWIDNQLNDDENTPFKPFPIYDVIT